MSLAADGVLQRLDARTGRRLTRIDVHRADPRAVGGGPLAVRGNQLWVAAPVHVDGDPLIGDASGWVGHLDVRRPKLRITQVHGDPHSYIAVGPAGVWVTGGGTLRRVDATSGEIVGVLRLPADLGAVAVGGNAVWVNEPNTGRLIEIDPRTRKVRGTVAIGRSTPGRSSLAVVGAVVWAATEDRVVSVDQRSRQVTATLRIPGALAVASGGSRLWVIGRDGLYSISAGKIAKHLGLSRGEAELIAVADRAVWLSTGSSNSLRRIQP